MSISSVYVTTSNFDESRRIAKEVVSERLAACANIFPEITSIFHWDDEVQETKESVLLIKTNSNLVEKLIAKVKMLHSYDVPCIIELKTGKSEQLFTKWLDEQTDSM